MNDYIMDITISNKMFSHVLENHKLVSSSDENYMILWNLNDPESKYILEGHTDKVTYLTHLSGNKFASVSLDKTLKIWE